jgi:hypothetical protein
MGSIGAGTQQSDHFSRGRCSTLESRVHGESLSGPQSAKLRIAVCATKKRVAPPVIIMHSVSALMQPTLRLRKVSTQTVNSATQKLLA